MNITRWLTFMQHMVSLDANYEDLLTANNWLNHLILTGQEGLLMVPGNVKGIQIKYKYDQIDFDEPEIEVIQFGSNDGGESLIAEIIEAIEINGYIDRGTINSLIGLTGRHSDIHWGWRDSKGIRVEPTEEFFNLILPKAQPLRSGISSPR